MNLTQSQFVHQTDFLMVNKKRTDIKRHRYQKGMCDRKAMFTEWQV